MEESPDLSIGPYVVQGRVGAPADEPAAADTRGFLVAHRDDQLRSVLHLARPATDESRLLIQTFARLGHPAIPTLIDLLDHEPEGEPAAIALVFELVQGVSLARLKGYLERGSEQLPDAAIWYIGHAVVGVLHEAHLRLA